MFDKLDDILFRLEEVLNQLNEPGSPMTRECSRS